jgi:signal recognition particle GTPase
MNIESLYTGISPDDVLEDLQDILLQADLGISTAEDVVAEVKSLREDSTKMLSRQDLFSIMRGKLIEALDTGKPGAVQFSTDDSIPTVIFIMGVSEYHLFSFSFSSYAQSSCRHI